MHSQVSKKPRKQSPQPPEPFIVKPYLQLGATAGSAKKRKLRLSWVSICSTDSLWSVEVRIRSAGRWHAWRTCSPATEFDFTITGLGKQTRHLVNLTGLKTGKLFEYRVLLNKQIVFGARATAPKRPDQPLRFVVLGDGADGSSDAARVAYAAHGSHPDLALFAGDNAYENGRPSEFQQRFFPAYNADVDGPEVGSSLLRQVVSALVPGNHDVRTPGFENPERQDSDAEDAGVGAAEASKHPDEEPDILGYFRFFDQPRTGPRLSTSHLRALQSGNKKRKRVARFVGNDLLTRTNYSFDYGDMHVLMLDGNKYADWSNLQLRQWVENDLEASKSTWKIVVIHQPPFTGGYYTDEQRNRRLCDIFQKHGVDIVFSGHCHAYERTHPLRFFAEGDPLPGAEIIPGTLALDLDYDGKLNTRPNGIIYVVTGTAGHIGGAAHHPKALDFSAKVVLDQPSYTMCDVRGRTLIVRQMDPEGNELDSFMIDK